jgi:hypothetical protein
MLNSLPRVKKIVINVELDTAQQDFLLNFSRLLKIFSQLSCQKLTILKQRKNRNKFRNSICFTLGITLINIDAIRKFFNYLLNVVQPKSTRMDSNLSFKTVVKPKGFVSFIYVFNNINYFSFIEGDDFFFMNCTFEIVLFFNYDSNVNISLNLYEKFFTQKY